MIIKDSKAYSPIYLNSTFFCQNVTFILWGYVYVAIDEASIILRIQLFVHDPPAYPDLTTSLLENAATALASAAAICSESECFDNATVSVNPKTTPDPFALPFLTVISNPCAMSDPAICADPPALLI
ncbi:hypothetical protein TNCT_611741 [Trichonephila clavata]|uniref:Uncharacterized protein n=1 Tax=Trichonephila clavata TaxID=2740835 RepID=A0A8X6H8S0_TRICU|nr:hypothetical protein TNCT_611741 [Trichonephila clavata]